MQESALAGGLATQEAPATVAATAVGELVRGERRLTAWQRVRQVVPEGLELPRATWEARHRTVLIVIAFHVVGLAAFGIYRGWGPILSIGESLAIGLLGLIAWSPRLGRRFRSATASLACVSSSAVLTQFAGGYIEAHFHYFVMVALIAMYQDWIPFLLAVLWVALDHGTIGTLLPQWVYNHPDAVAHPWKWGVIHAVLILGECGALLAFWGGAESARKRSDLVLDSAGEGILGLGLDRRITFANPSAAAILGARHESLEGKALDDVLGGLEGARIDLPWNIAAAATAGRPPSEGVVHRDGTTVPVEWVATPIVRAHLPIGHVVTLRDITERKRSQEALERSNRDLQQFAYVASHDLQEPLRMVSSFVRLLGDRYKGRMDADADEYIHFAVDGATRMQRLVDDLLAFSRVSSRARPVAETDAGAVLEEVLAALRTTVSEGKAQVEVGAMPRLPADASQLGLVFQNLIANAVKFHGDKPPRIKVAAVLDGEDWHFTVADNGIGIDMAHATRLFQIFQRLHRDEYPGTGIGLAICKKIVERHGGRIWIESTPGQGATFHFTIPRMAAATASMPEPQAAVRLVGRASAPPNAMTLTVGGRA